MNNNAPKMEPCGYLIFDQVLYHLILSFAFLYDLNQSSSIPLIPYIYSLFSIISLSIVSKDEKYCYNLLIFSYSSPFTYDIAYRSFT